MIFALKADCKVEAADIDEALSIVIDRLIADFNGETAKVNFLPGSSLELREQREDGEPGSFLLVRG